LDDAFAIAGLWAKAHSPASANRIARWPPQPATNLEAARDDFYDRLTPEGLTPLSKVLAALPGPNSAYPPTAI
jgi:hypothetical protein